MFASYLQTVEELTVVLAGFLLRNLVSSVRCMSETKRALYSR